MNTPSFTGTVRFKVAGQEALPRWARQAISNALETADSPPESLRFQCRIATDARENFKEINLKGGETLKLHPRSAPQFGKTAKGEPYLTASMVYSGDGKTYKLRWVGLNVPMKMQEVAVKHDMGLSVRATTVGLSLANAEVTPSVKANNNQSRRGYNTPYYQNRDRTKAPKRSRTCARLTADDLAAV